VLRDFHPVLDRDRVLDEADILALAGLAIMRWARVTLGRNGSGGVVLKEDHELIRSPGLPETSQGADTFHSLGQSGFGAVRILSVSKVQ
jgi:hypothetical protein